MSENLSIKDELLRKLIHICSSAFAFALFFLNQQAVCLIVGFGAILILFFEILRSKYYPVNKMIFVLSIRKLESKIGKQLNDDQKNGQLKRSRFISIILILFFSCLFNINILSVK